MCHGKAVAAFPPPVLGEAVTDGGISAYRWPQAAADKRIAILPDIYGCNPFYQGLAGHLAERGAEVHLIDTFAGLGELAEMTREAAFARRHQVRDKAFLDLAQSYLGAHQITGVIGFCLGGLYVFELARRGVDAALVGLYGFPQGLPNQDALDAPFDYLHEISTPFTMLLGAEDAAVGPENIQRLQARAPDLPAMALTVYDGVGHDFLPLLDSDEPAKRAVAEDALARLDAALLKTPS
ncbi:MAG: dienelactone hydrolase family protein [Pseudomonadota bacterium]